MKRTFENDGMEERGGCKAAHVEGSDDPLQRNAHEHDEEPAGEIK